MPPRFTHRFSLVPALRVKRSKGGPIASGAIWDNLTFQVQGFSE
jgi:hypothetical protein